MTTPLMIGGGGRGMAGVPGWAEAVLTVNRINRATAEPSPIETAGTVSTAILINPTVYSIETVIIQNSITINGGDPDVRELKDTIRQLVSAIEGSNEASAEVRRQLRAEITAGNALLEAPKVEPNDGGASPRALSRPPCHHCPTAIEMRRCRPNRVARQGLPAEGVADARRNGADDKSGRVPRIRRLATSEVHGGPWEAPLAEQVSGALGSAPILSRYQPRTA